MHAWPSAFGDGIVRTLGQTAKYLKELGHDVQFITAQDFTTNPCPTYPSSWMTATLACIVFMRST
jgi:hypothetical protein